MNKVILGSWGYAIVEDDKVFIPVIMGGMKDVLADIYKKTSITRMIFSAVLNPNDFKTHLRNIVREWDEWFEEVGDYSHLIEIKYEPKINEA